MGCVVFLVTESHVWCIEESFSAPQYYFHSYSGLQALLSTHPRGLCPLLLIPSSPHPISYSPQQPLSSHTLIPVWNFPVQWHGDIAHLPRTDPPQDHGSPTGLPLFSSHLPLLKPWCPQKAPPTTTTHFPGAQLSSYISSAKLINLSELECLFWKTGMIIKPISRSCHEKKVK